jgi:hypothetical protein
LPLAFAIRVDPCSSVALLSALIRVHPWLCYPR